MSERRKRSRLVATLGGDAYPRAKRSLCQRQRHCKTRPFRWLSHCLVAARSQQSPDFGGRLRRAEQKALHFVAAERSQQVALRLGLDALCRGGDVACRSDVHHRFDDARRPAGLRDVLDKATVDLDLVERKALQIASVSYTH